MRKDCSSRNGGVEMESIPGYDDWKTTPPDDPEPASLVCDCCGKYLWEGEPIYLDINGENLCEVCLNKMYRRIL